MITLRERVGSAASIKYSSFSQEAFWKKLRSQLSFCGQALVVDPGIFSGVGMFDA